TQYLENGVLLRSELPNDKMKTCLKHFRYLLEIKPERTAILEMRTHASWYLKGLKGGVAIKKQLYKISNKEEFESLISHYMETLQ
ncbi:MAG: tRNA-dihydrouridine synthase, partial [Bacilli bacterium]